MERTSERRSSYPYLVLARTRGIPYGTVLHFATVTEAMCAATTSGRLSDWTPSVWERAAVEALADAEKRAIVEAVLAEHQRRREVSRAVVS